MGKKEIILPINKIILACITGVILLNADAKAQQDSANDSDLIIFIADNPIIAAMDSLLLNRFIEWDSFTTNVKELNIYYFPKDSVPDYPDSVYQRRMKNLDNLSPFPLVYNEVVQAYINLYVKKRRELASRMLGLSQTYFPMFEEMLNKNNLPLELKYLPIVESALNPTAKSHAGAVGLWQFMYNTAKLYNVEINSMVDERMDPLKETEIACNYLSYLYKLYHDWGLALAAYNAGPGNVNKAIRKSGDKMTYWEVRSFLPKETQGYVPAFIAVNYLMNYSPEHNIYPVKPTIKYYETDTLLIDGGISLAGIADGLNIDLQLLLFLNPMYITGIIPITGKKMPLHIKKKDVGEFIVNESCIREWEEIKQTIVNKEVKEIYSTTTNKLNYKVKSGEYLGIIAKKFHCSVKDLKKWNGLKSNDLKSGQHLIVYLNGAIPKVNNKKTEKKVTPTNKNSSNKKDEYYTIKYGDTLWDIANKYGTTVEILMQLNKGIDTNDLKNGQKIKIKSKG